jgi:predicted amidohydrolase
MGVRVTAETLADLEAKGATVGPTAKVPENLRDVPEVSANPTCQALFVPSWFPTPLNKLLTCHWGKAGRMKAADAALVALAARQAGIRPATGPRRLDMHLILPKGKRVADTDAYWKVAKDALVGCHVLVDDTRRLCRDGQITFSRAETDFWGTLIVLTDV